MEIVCTPTRGTAGSNPAPSATNVKIKTMKFITALFLILFAISTATAEQFKLYLPFTYPGSLGKFEVNSTGKYEAVLGYKGRKFLFKGIQGEKELFFVIPYRVQNDSFSLSLYRNGKRIFFTTKRVTPKYYRISRIWVKERSLKGELLKRVLREEKLLKRVLNQVTPKKFKENRLYPPLKKLSVSTPFGAKRIINGKRHSIHWGTDFRAKTGTPVYASLSGKVVLARNLYFTGNTVVIDHGLGIHTLYAHLSKIAVKEGQFVKAGKVIGKVGSTGRSTGPHLHFGFYVEGVRADPMLVMKERL